MHASVHLWSEACAPSSSHGSGPDDSYVPGSSFWITAAFVALFLIYFWNAAIYPGRKIRGFLLNMIQLKICMDFAWPACEGALWALPAPGCCCPRQAEPARVGVKLRSF